MIDCEITSNRCNHILISNNHLQDGETLESQNGGCPCEVAVHIIAVVTIYRVRGRVGRRTPWPCLKLRCAGGREFDPRPGQYSRMSFSSDPGDWYGFLIWTCLSFQILNLFRTLSSWGSGNYRPSAPFLYEVASHVKNCHSGHYYYTV